MKEFMGLLTFEITEHENEKGHRGNGDQLEKALMQIKDTTKLCTEVKRTDVLSAGNALFNELTDAFQQLACAKDQVELYGLRVHEIKTKLKCIGLDPEQIDKELEKMRTEIL